MKLIDLSELKSLEGLANKIVKITTTSDEVYKGVVTSYDKLHDALEIADVKTSTHNEYIDRTMIKSIEEIELSEMDNSELLGIMIAYSKLLNYKDNIEVLDFMLEKVDNKTSKETKI